MIMMMMSSGRCRKYNMLQTAAIAAAYCSIICLIAAPALTVRVVEAREIGATTNSNNNNNTKVEMAVNPTEGFEQLAFSCEIQRPLTSSSSWDAGQRFSFDGSLGVYDFWTLSSDSPPAVELRVAGLDYTSGTWQFEGEFNVAGGPCSMSSSGIVIMQVVGGGGDTTIAGVQLRIANGTLDARLYNINAKEESTNYVDIVMMSSRNAAACDRWVQLNVVHDADKGNLKVYVDRSLRVDQNISFPKPHYFKCGTVFATTAAAAAAAVDTAPTPPACLESRWKNISVWKKPSAASRKRSGSTDSTTTNWTASCFPQ